MLKVNSITKSFDKQVVLKDLDLTVNDGSIFGLVGVNGAGKSTLLRSIAGIYILDKGTITFNNEDTYKDVRVRKDIFFVNDDTYFPFASSIKSLKEFYKSFYSIDEVQFNKAIAIFGLDVNKPITTFSKGMKRQTLLCFALAIKPKLLLLDEAFDGLDPVVRYNLKNALADFIEDNHSTIIISSHNLKELEDICDSYGILENGQINTYGDLLESKANINKYQIAFKEPIDEIVFNDFNLMKKSKQGSVYTLVIKGDKQETLDKLNALHPVILDSLSVNFEELFIYEHEGGNR
ncbi:MAG: ABC transporter ATP-binding protein [Firmicutes bacterium]|nr:ABC transporter ATP-binding protein [Candidatus Colivicinus equi]